MGSYIGTGFGFGAKRLGSKDRQIPHQHGNEPFGAKKPSGFKAGQKKRKH